MTGTSTSRLQLYKAAGADNVNFAQDISSNWDKIDEAVERGCKYEKTDADGPTIATGTEITAKYDHMVYQDLSIVTYNSSTGVFTIVKPGMYSVEGNGSVTGSTAGGGERLYSIRSSKEEVSGNGIARDSDHPPINAHSFMSAAGRVRCVAGDTIWGTVTQNSGASVDFRKGVTSMCITWVGP